MLIVIEGPMKAGKSSILIDMIESFKKSYDEIGTLHVFNHKIGRNGEFVKSRDRNRSYPAKKIDDSDLEGLTIPENRLIDSEEPRKPWLIAIDEAQFFGKSLLTLAWKTNQLSSQTTLIVAGLGLDSDGHPFGPMQEIASLANRVIRCRANCQVCKQPANKTFCLVEKTGQILVDEADEQYEPRCERCWREGVRDRSRTVGRLS